MQRLPMTLLLLLIRWRLSSCLFQIEDDVRCSPDIMCRIQLISKANQILDSYGALSTRKCLSMSNRELLGNRYVPTMSLTAVTSEHIYISRDETTYYKVPKSLNSLLEEIRFNSNAGIMLFKNASDGAPTTYIAFGDYNLITTSAQQS